VQEKRFWRRVVRALSLMAYLSDVKSKNFPSTVENIAFVLMDKVNQARMELERETQQVLDYLVQNKAVVVHEGRYSFSAVEKNTA